MRIATNLRPNASRRFFFCLGILTLITGVFLSPALAKGVKTYKHLIVQTFEVPDSSDFPADFAAALRHNLIHQLEDTRRFERVTFLDNGQQAPADADLVLTGKIVRFDKGSRMARYMVPGAGMTKIKAMISFTDPVASKSILDREVSGKVVMGVFGGDSKGATNGLAKDVAKAAKKGLP